MDGTAEACLAAVLSVFPGVCLDYVKELAEQKDNTPELVIADILDDAERGKPYPRRRDSLKRKEPHDGLGHEQGDEILSLEDEIKKFSSPDRQQLAKQRSYAKISKSVLKYAFPHIYAKDMRAALKVNDNRLLPTYLSLRNMKVGFEEGDLRPKVKIQIPEVLWTADKVKRAIKNSIHESHKSALEEFQAAERIATALEAQRLAEQQKEMQERANLNAAQLNGTAAECQCCYDEFATNRMVYCDGKIAHWFCRACAKRMADAQIGLARYRLNCMSTDGCLGGFSHAQREIFLDEKFRAALDRIEQEEAVRMADIDNLETCPFCPFAAECDPVDIDREFRCRNPSCELVSCRLCRRVTHIPLRCEEVSLREGLSKRRVIEEAMSSALIRKCNKFATRHRMEVEKAEEETRRQIMRENPDIDADLLKICMSEKVKDNK
ncbi:hypothetical protein VTK73DRAFT_3813 [Phialemonium thermophilum]|uniref:RING-type domain-containing protein n=1 Tax=Phialemonium thermophilum TaxID=223376 RepID=A0ABR3WX01_9PEZI